MKYEEFKSLIESKVLNRTEYLKLSKKLGAKKTENFFEQYILEEDAFNNEVKFRYVESYYFEKMEAESEHEEEFVEQSMYNENEQSEEENNNDGRLATNSITEYLNDLKHPILLNPDQEKELATKMNCLYNNLKEKIILNNKELYNLAKDAREENRRDIEEVLIDNYLNTKLNELNIIKY